MLSTIIRVEIETELGKEKWSFIFMLNFNIGLIITEHSTLGQMASLAGTNPNFWTLILANESNKISKCIPKAIQNCFKN